MAGTTWKAEHSKCIEYTIAEKSESIRYISDMPKDPQVSVKGEKSIIPEQDNINKTENQGLGEPEGDALATSSTSFN